MRAIGQSSGALNGVETIDRVAPHVLESFFHQDPVKGCKPFGGVQEEEALRFSL